MKELTNKIYQKMKKGEITPGQDYFDISNGWRNISMYYELSEDIIREFQDDVEWYYISGHQNISYEFIVEFISKIDLAYLKCNEYLKQKLTESQWKTIEFMKRL